MEDGAGDDGLAKVEIDGGIVVIRVEGHDGLFTRGFRGDGGAGRNGWRRRRDGQGFRPDGGSGFGGGVGVDFRTGGLLHLAVGFGYPENADDNDREYFDGVFHVACILWFPGQI